MVSVSLSIHQLLSLRMILRCLSELVYLLELSESFVFIVRGIQVGVVGFREIMRLLIILHTGAKNESSCRNAICVDEESR